MPCYLFKNTSETFTTTFGPKPCTYQNSIKFQPNSPNPSLSLFFPLLSLQDQLGHTLAGHLSLFPSLILFVPCGWTKGGGSPRQSLPRCHPPSLSHSSHPPIPNQRRATAQECPRTLSASACSSQAPYPLSRSPRPPSACPCRPGHRGQARPCYHATRAP
jgi:hypothetical protein